MSLAQVDETHVSLSFFPLGITVSSTFHPALRFAESGVIVQDACPTGTNISFSLSSTCWGPAWEEDL